MSENSPVPPDRDGRTFGELLNWHLLRGTRPGGLENRVGRAWGKKEFAATVGLSDRTVRFWLQNQHLPPEIETIERVLFGNDPASHTQWRLALRRAHEESCRSRDGQAGAPSIPSISNLPYPPLGGLFKGRDAFLKRLRESLTREGGGHSAIVSKAIYGLGGIGKTRAAVEYAHCHKSDYRTTLFVIAASPGALRHNLAALADPMILDLPQQHEADQETRLRGVCQWLNAHPGWLLILDNLDTKEAMAEAHSLMARLSGGHVVITSRLGAFASYIEPIELDVLGIDEAAEFLLQRTQHHRLRTDDDEAIARNIGEDLGGLALALEQAGAYIDKSRLGLLQYRSLWRENWPRVAHWADESITHYPCAVAVTWETSIGRLQGPARRLLARLSWLASEPIPYFMFDHGLPSAAPAPRDAAQHFEALDDLAAYSLVRCDAMQAEFGVHRLVQDVTRRSLNDELQRDTLIEAMHWLDSAFSGDPEDAATRSRLDRLALHAHALVEHGEFAKLRKPTVQLMKKLGDYAVSKALYAEARPRLERALAIGEELFGLEHQETAKIINSLIVLRQAEGDIAGARMLSERSLAICEKVFGPEHPETAAVLNNLLGGLTRAQGDLPGALQHCRRALAIREKALGPEHPDTARSLNDVGSVFRSLGDLAAARPLCERALAIREKVLGAEHVDTARSLTTLALLAQAEGDLEEAQSLNERALAIREKVFGPDHPHTARSLNNLAQICQAQGKIAEARSLYQRALTIREMVLGTDHLDTATSLSNLACLLRSEGETFKALQLLERAYAAREKVLGPAHSETLGVKREFLALKPD